MLSRVVAAGLVSLFAAVACSAPPAPLSKGDQEVNARPDTTENDAGPAVSNKGDAGSARVAPSAATCSGTKSRNACEECCLGPDMAAKTFFDKKESECCNSLAKAASCSTLCAERLCGGEPNTSDDGKCDHCVVDPRKCEDVAVKACSADPNCSAAQKCVTESKCGDKPRSKDSPPPAEEPPPEDP